MMMMMKIINEETKTHTNICKADGQSTIIYNKQNMKKKSKEQQQKNQNTKQNRNNLRGGE